MARAPLLALLLGSLSMTIASAAGKQCATAGLPAPTVSTLMVSPTNASEAWLLHPDCELDVIGTVIDTTGDTPITELNCGGKMIQQIKSLPKAQRLIFTKTAIKEADFTSPPGTQYIILSDCNLETIANFKFPTTLLELNVDGNIIRSIAEGALPNSLTNLYLGSNGLRSVENISLPDSIRYVSFMKNKLTALDFSIPDGLGILELYTNAIPRVENITMPDSLVEFLSAECEVTSFRGVKLSSKLEILEFSASNISFFEVRESDVAVLKTLRIFGGNYLQKTCESDARLVAINENISVCVVTDELFEAKYPVRLEPSPPSKFTTRAPSPSSSSDHSNGSPSTPAPTPTGVDTSSSSSSSSSPLIIIVLIVTGVVCVVVAVICNRVFCGAARRKQKSSRPSDGNGPNKNHNQYTDASTLDQQAISSNMTASNDSQEYLTNDVRNDEELMPFRIAYKDVHLHRVIAKGGFGVVHMGKVGDREVAVKQLLPDRCRDMRAIKSFMDEIRLCAKLDHPKIVAFVGIAWNTLLDMAVVIEYMRGGDLGSVLYAQPSISSRHPYHWFESTDELKAKSLLALDVIEALAYLHSFHSPIIHRDLKAKNVLLTGEGNAKLADFGISREVPMDETMTGEVGTVAWIAPEILQGERYSEKADIYSFGVVLVELDTGRHPYSQDDSDGTTPQSNARIAMLVSTGQLHPPMSESCPSPVYELAMRCLSFRADDRPPAIQIHYELRKIREHGSQAGRLV